MKLLAICHPGVIPRSPASKDSMGKAKLMRLIGSTRRLRPLPAGSGRSRRPAAGHLLRPTRHREDLHRPPLAEHLTGANGEAVVQFHPSNTYEDFFEGYRPGPATRPAVVRADPGPLQPLAEPPATRATPMS